MRDDADRRRQLGRGIHHLPEMPVEAKQVFRSRAGEGG